MKRSYAVAVIAMLIVGVLVASLAGGDGGGEDGDGSTPIATAPGCPEIPSEYANVGGNVWPAEAARELVPFFPDICATPVAPPLFFLLNENFSFAEALEAGAHGIIHREDEVIATFLVIRVREGTPGLEDGLPRRGGAVTEAGGITLLWARAGNSIRASWIDGHDIVYISASDETTVLDAVASWFRAEQQSVGVLLPEEIPTLRTGLEAPLEAGLPSAGLPDGYVALELDPLAFQQSDFADGASDVGVDAMGAAIVIAEDGHLVGTLVATGGSPEGIGSEPFEFEAESLPPGFTDAGFVAGGVNAFVIGHDESTSEFIDAWEAAL